MKKYMIVKYKDDLDNPYSRCWILLEVTSKDLKRGMNADRVGLYGFGGMWYGRNPTKHKSYGKISPIESLDEVVVIKNNIHGMSVNDIRKLVN